MLLASVLSSFDTTSPHPKMLLGGPRKSQLYRLPTSLAPRPVWPDWVIFLNFGFLGYIHKCNNSAKTAVVIFWATFGIILATFISSSGHTGPPATSFYFYFKFTSERRKWIWNRKNAAAAASASVTRLGDFLSFGWRMFLYMVKLGLFRKTLLFH